MISPGEDDNLGGPRLREAWRFRRAGSSGFVYWLLRWGGVVIFAAVVVSLVVSLVWQAAPAFRHSGLFFLFGGTWNATKSEYGAGVFILDALITTALAMVLVIPIGIGTAAVLSEFSPGWLAGPLAAIVGLLAGGPVGRATRRTPVPLAAR